MISVLSILLMSCHATVATSQNSSAGSLGFLQKQESQVRGLQSCDKHYEIVLDKSGGTKLGLDFTPVGGTILRIKAIKDGLMDDWNNKNPYKNVEVNDHIVEINGVKDDAVQLLSEFAKDTILKIKLVHYVCKDPDRRC
mmetsp:Transcript_73883/g.135038  ORF Transcript_73883/g.135038 Transcript_73883/m.135038 type:complete len:139 (-) Transcript_73883:164-580(-)